jgi:hypothetical protein
MARVERLARVEDLLDAEVGLAREVLDRGRVLPAGLEAPRGALDPQRVLEQIPGRADVPAAVAEVAAQLAVHGRHRERAERRAVVGVEAVDRLEQPERRDLLEVLERLRAAGELRGREARERQVALDQPLAQRWIAGAVEPLQQRLVGSPCGDGGLMCRCDDRVHASFREREGPAGAGGSPPS